MKKYIIISILCIGMSLINVGCQRQTNLEAEEAVIGQETEEDLEAEEVIDEEIMEETILQGDEEITREYHFVLPDGWAICKTKQSEQSSLELQGNSDEQYAAVIVLDEALLTNNDIEAYINRYVEETKLSYEDTEVGEIETIPASSGTAHKIKLDGALDGKVYTNLLYVIDAEEYWYITTACSFVSKAYDLEKDMDEFVVSFYKAEDVIEDVMAQDVPEDMQSDTVEDSALVSDE